MNFDFSILISNHLINVGVVSWMVAQLLKTIIHLFTKGEFKRERLAGAGGMPSSHSAVTCSVLLLSYLLYGFDSPIFAMAFILALIVMYDATGVRWAAGLHAKAINYIVEYLADENAKDKAQLNEMIPKLNESLGHRMIEVVCGAALVGLRLRPDWFEGKRLISYKKIPEYVRSNVAGMNEEEFSEAYAAMEAERAAAAAKELKRRSKAKKE